MNLLLSAPLCFLLCSMLPVDSMMISLSFTSQDVKQPVPLNMADDAVDDMYDGCRENMTKKVNNKYFKKENTGKFKSVWKRAEPCVNRTMKQKDPKDKALTREHMQAICVYTSSTGKFYRIFNDAVRTGRSKYGTSFPYHSLHFWLTTAVQILNKEKKCETTYRRTNLDFTGKVNQKMRFGSFTSTAKTTPSMNFGQKTCFKIQTCSGAYLKHYTYLNDEEKEVLIPPYEVFNITGKKNGRDVKELDDCEVVYLLKSIRVLSNLNCKAVK
ncbi:T-cell ecto-ADP-ribosyltransferase 1-like isoform X2 [Anabas testudineus]|uniref:NAD(P)(+)--arginine ADP-ribosyltransferase n=2 Tax=Anabas testudineus TaxID=64144 RepID=A0A3Q1HGJ4_ANATE|nr:T-cell ecto-ADP-ribosyltransferase 1-like isoform X2 [Anabas testudineus]XP_026219017.1 T-cell ecto-ADP-ribosyltransferase 1-like isoform X2 [Anabas testudineus]